MIHMSYDNDLVIGSAVVAVIVCYIAISLEQLIYNIESSKKQKVLMIASGMIFGLAIWAMHFVGMLACHLPEGYSFDPGLTIFSYVIAAITSTFAIWLTTRQTLPLGRLVLGAALMGGGISGMHYVGMMGLNVPNQDIHYDSLIVLFSILIGVSGSGLSFWLAFKYKQAMNHRGLLKFAVACMIAFSIVGMHYTGMASIIFHTVENPTAIGLNYNESQTMLLVAVIFATCLTLIAAFAVAMLELRLEERNHQLLLANKELESLVLQDNLTKLPNRLFLIDYTNGLFMAHRQLEGEVAFIYIDLDRFKSVNDAFGHHIGDELLVKLAQRLHHQLTDNQKLMRIGGDEFLLIVENTTQVECEEFAALLLAKIQESFKISGKEINISASIGIVLYPKHGSGLQDLLINAEAAMMQSKEQGRNTYSIYNEKKKKKQSNRSQSKLINDLYRAVEEHQFVLFYQPKFTADYKICGVEALIRWKHPNLGLLAPSMFIEGAEQTGLIIRMGYWALEQACSQLYEWKEKGIDFSSIAVNLSAIQFEHKQLICRLEALIQKYKIAPSSLIIEITESTAMQHIETSIQTFEKLRSLGILLAIDDFGTGHSSFLYLKNLPVDELKIDREFIRNLTPNSKEEIILESIIQLAKRLGLVVTAEGVETELQAEILKRLGCQQLQGYLLGMPLPVQRLEESYAVVT